MNAFGTLEVDEGYLRLLLEERAARGLEALRLYEPHRMQAAFHRSHAPERIIRAANRGGKTLAAAVEVSRALTNQDPHKKWPKSGVFYIVGKDGKELSQVLWKKLAREGPFKMIRDRITKLWRAYRPYDPNDLARADEAREAPPLIPPRFIKDIAWESRKDLLPKSVRFVTGWEVHFYSAEAIPPRGSDIDGAWFDEEVASRDWYDEISARLIDRSGKFIWSATPQAGSEVLYDLSQRAEEERIKGRIPYEPVIEEFHCTMDDNPHLTKKQKEQFMAKMTDDQRLVRVGGQFAMLSTIIYPEYSSSTFEVPYFDIPKTWTRYVSIDPGRQICAGLFLAVPPDNKHVYLYDEMYIPNATAYEFGKAMQQKCSRDDIRLFLIDDQEGRKRETGSGRSIKEQYGDELAKRNVRSELTGSWFMAAAAEPKAGIEAFRSWLLWDGEEPPKLRVIQDKCPNFVSEIKSYRYKRRKTPKGWITTDEPEDRGRVHQMANARYLAQYNPQYHAPTPKQEPDAIVKAFRRIKEREAQQSGGPYVALGPK